LSEGGYIQHGRRHSPRGGSDKIPGVPVTVHGRVESTIGILGGSGDWDVSGDGAGNFTVTFNAPFANPPTVVASENETTTSPPSFIQVFNVTAADFDVVTYNDSGVVDEDIGFNFIAVGPA